MEQGQTFGSTVPRFATNDPNYRILARQRSRFTHYHFYIRNETLGPMVTRVASFFLFQTTYYLNGDNFVEKELGRKKVPELNGRNLRLARAQTSLPVFPCSLLLLSMGISRK